MSVVAGIQDREVVTIRSTPIGGHALKLHEVVPAAVPLEVNQERPVLVQFIDETEDSMADSGTSRIGQSVLPQDLDRLGLIVPARAVGIAHLPANDAFGKVPLAWVESKL